MKQILCLIRLKSHNQNTSHFWYDRSDHCGDIISRTPKASYLLLTVMIVIVLWKLEMNFTECWMRWVHKFQFDKAHLSQYGILQMLQSRSDVHVAPITSWTLVMFLSLDAMFAFMLKLVCNAGWVERCCSTCLCKQTRSSQCHECCRDYR